MTFEQSLLFRTGGRSHFRIPGIGVTHNGAVIALCNNRLDAVRDGMIRLFAYYGSEDWYEDREGPLPERFAAGVLSEDAVYDQITLVRDAAIRMLETATDILKNRL